MSRSNAIVLAQGKPHSRDWRRAAQPGGRGGVGFAQKAAGEATNAAMASDAFFPFPDSIEFAARAGVTCVIQPGGSIRDAQVIEAADHYDMAMIFTGARHFRH